MRDMTVAKIEIWMKCQGAPEEGKPSKQVVGCVGVGTEGNVPWFEYWLCS